ncbi:hypothetical protein GLOIN_2v1868927 [Rhizophagus irregularis DAOM 181602=DAOM 197198]|nr:hypothetical protein GLOIN_2v1868927 [Rhizophagus irregularis DAOM 181602=DAOM 197198]
MKPKTNVAPPRKYLKFKLDSTLIESKHVSLFASWIDKKDSSYYNSKNCPYEFKLLYRSGQDGFNAESFHKNCDNKGATIWIAKIKGSTQLIGGYNPLDWGGNCGQKNTTDSFLFNFTDGNDISSVKLGPINNLTGASAIYCYNNQGPSMGSLNSKNSNNWSYYAGSTTYPNIGIPSKFTIENYETFSIVKQ